MSISGTLILAAGLRLVNVSDSEAGFWDWQLSEPFNLNLDVKVLVLDGETFPPETIQKLNARGIKTVCYVSVGTHEDWRPDADQFPPEILGNPLGDWPGERYLDIRRMELVLPLMFERFDACKANGFAAIEPDNMDAFENDNGFGLSMADNLTYITALTEYAHILGLEIAQKNTPELIGPLHQIMDFMIVEDCFRWNFCEELMPYRRAGKDVLAVEYTETTPDWEAVCEAARRMGFHLLLKEREITAGGKVCLWDN